MNKSRHVKWSRQLDGIADELVRLSAICEVNLRNAGVIERILKNDDSDCGKKNQIAFKKLRRLLAATFGSLNKAIDKLGADEVKVMTDQIRARIDRHREAGGLPPRAPRKLRRGD